MSGKYCKDNDSNNYYSLASCEVEVKRNSRCSKFFTWSKDGNDCRCCTNENNALTNTGSISEYSIYEVSDIKVW